MLYNLFTQGGCNIFLLMPECTHSNETALSRVVERTKRNPREATKICKGWGVLGNWPKPRETRNVAQQHLFYWACMARLGAVEGQAQRESDTRRPMTVRKKSSVWTADVTGSLAKLTARSNQASWGKECAALAITAPPKHNGGHNELESSSRNDRRDQQGTSGTK